MPGARWHNGPREGRASPSEGRRTQTGRARTTSQVELRTYIVEDNATIREYLIGTLEELASVRSLGWAEAENDARNWLDAHRGGWDLAIIDLFLKQGSGLGVLEACQDRGRDQRVVVLSNYATDEMRKRCAQLGADIVFDKSNEIDALVDYCLDLGQAAGSA
jgi:two-component system OmpR family response regulator